MFGEDEVVRRHKGRSDLIFQIIVFCFSIILMRLWYLQIYKGEDFYRYSLNNRLRRETIRAPRGMIYSRDNQLLVHNVPRLDAIITPQYLANREQTIARLAEILSMPVESVNRIMSRYTVQPRYIPILIKKNISNEEVAKIETEAGDLPGVTVQSFIGREYLSRETGSHLFGYISEIAQGQLDALRNRDKIEYSVGDFIGQAGIEREFDLKLRGEEGVEFVEVDARGRKRRTLSGDALFADIENIPATSGNSVRLTIDNDVQEAAYEALGDWVGSVVVTDVNTGEIIAMVSKPGFDPKQFSKGLTKTYWDSLRNDERNPMRDRTIQEHYPPGSTFKPFILIAALEEGIVGPEEELMATATFRVGQRVFSDWKKDGHGPTDAIKSLRRSVDVYYYKIGTELDIDVLASYLKDFGFGATTGITLPREVPGIIPSREWKEKRFGEPWQLGETVVVTIGQSYVLVTPLQLAMAYAAIANGGTLYRPTLVRDIFNNTGEIVSSFTPEVVRKMDLDPELLKYVKEGLHEVVNEPSGTAFYRRKFGLDMAGKTGTAQVRSFTREELFMKCSEKPYRSRHHGLFAGYAPFDDPKIAFSVVIEHGCGGSSAAAPVAMEVVEAYMKKYEPETYKKLYEEDRKKYFGR